MKTSHIINICFLVGKRLRRRFRCQEEVYSGHQGNKSKTSAAGERQGSTGRWRLPGRLPVQASKSRTWQLVLPQVQPKHFPCRWVSANILKATLYKTSWKHMKQDKTSTIPTHSLSYLISSLPVAATSNSIDRPQNTAY